MIRLMTMATALLFTGLAVAQGLPRFGTAKFGEASFGMARACLTRSFHAPMGNHPACCRAVGCCVPHANQGDLK